MIPVMTSFLPPTRTHLYLPTLFRLWEAFNSSIIDDRLIELVGDLSEEHVAGKFGSAGEDGGAEWKDVGIWTEKEWIVLIGKGLGSMSERLLSTYHYISDRLSDMMRRPRWSHQSKVFTRTPKLLVLILYGLGTKYNSRAC
jgi:hypothetical protein